MSRLVRKRPFQGIKGRFGGGGEGDERKVTFQGLEGWNERLSCSLREFSILSGCE
jgi:hypothetical protein